MSLVFGDVEVTNNISGVGLSSRRPAVVATTTAATLSSSFEDGDTIDGYTLVTGDRILIKNQSSGVENGVYIVNASGAPTRTPDYSDGDQVASSFIFIEQGTSNSDTGWLCTNVSGSDVVGTDALVFMLGAGGIVKVQDEGTPIANNPHYTLNFVGNTVTAADAGAGVASITVTMPVTTKGDIFTYDTTNARLPVGTNDYAVLADSAQTTGLKWAAIVNSVTTNTGLSTNVSATGAVTITNTGVTSFTSNTGLSTNVSATGAVTVTNTGMVNVQDEGSAITGTPHTTLNFVGNTVAASNSGGGIAAITITMPVTTKGDIFTYSSTNARLPVGSNTQVLMADSAQTTGLKWASVVTSLTSNTGLSTNVSATGDVTVTNTGVLSNIAGTGISVSGATGNVTIGNTGVLSLTTNTGLSTNVSATGNVTVTNTGVISLAGTTNQVAVSGSTGSVTISTPSTFIAPGTIQDSSGMLYSTTAAISAAGINQTGATALTTSYNIVSTVGSGEGVKLPVPGAAGYIVNIVNNGANALNIYPASGGTIDAAASNAAISLPIRASITLQASTTTQWYSVNPPIIAGTNTSVTYGNGATTVNSTGSVIVQDEGSGLANNPHTTLNFIGARVTATDAGSGVATVSIPALLTTKGDVFTFDTAEARLPVGTNNQVLMADSATGTGLKWFDVVRTLTTNTGLSTNVSATGTVTVTNTGMVNVQEEGSAITGTPHTTLNFTGARVTASDATGGIATIAIPTPLTTKGDIVAYSTLETRLGVGTNDQALIADSATATGLKWAAIANSIAGTTNQVTASSATGNVTLSTPSTFIAPGTIQDTTGMLYSTSATITAAGTVQGDATALTKSYNVVTTVASGTGVVLQTPSAAGYIVTVVNNGANTLNVYPAVGGAIDGLASNLPITLLAGGNATFQASTTTLWETVNPPVVAGNGMTVTYDNGATTVSTNLLPQQLPNQVISATLTTQQNNYDPVGLSTAVQLLITPAATNATTIAAGSNGAVLPQATINVVSTTGFSASGTIYIVSSAGTQPVFYTGVGGTTFTGCTGGTGSLTTGNIVSSNNSITISGIQSYGTQAVPLLSYLNITNVLPSCLSGLAGSGTSCTVSGKILTVGGTVTGTWVVGMLVAGAGVTANTFITTLGTGTGGAGTYNLNNSMTIGTPQTITGTSSIQYNLILANQSTASTTANRFFLDGQDAVLTPGQNYMIFYDFNVNAWRGLGCSDDGNLGGAFITAGVLTPPLITNTNENNYAPAGLLDATLIRLTAGQVTNITGITGGVGGRYLYMVNVGTNPITLANLSGLSQPLNQIYTGTSNATIVGNALATLVYDGVSGFWRISGGTGGATSGVGGLVQSQWIEVTQDSTTTIDTWSNGYTTCNAPFSLSQATATTTTSANATTFTVTSTTNFPSTGIFTVNSTLGAQYITYTGKTSTTFTGCSGGLGTITSGAIVVANSATGLTTTTTTTAANSATFTVASTLGFPAAGKFTVLSTSGLQTITYTGGGGGITTAGTSFTGCSGGVGTITSGATCTNINMTVLSTSATAPVPSYPGNIAFPSSGVLIVQSAYNNVQLVNYTSLTGTTQYTGITGGFGVVLTGNDISGGPITTTITAGSNGVSLPQATINVTSTTGFTAATSLTPGYALVTTSSGTQHVSYTGLTGTTLTGCVGGLGIMTTGNLVSDVSIDPTDLMRIPIKTSGGAIIISATACASAPSGKTIYFQVVFDGYIRRGGAQQGNGTAPAGSVVIGLKLSPVTAGDHVCCVRWLATKTNNAMINPVSDAIYNNASLLCQEVSS